MRELRDYFQRVERHARGTLEPRNIWEGNYFHDLNDLDEEEDLRARELLQNNQERKYSERDLDLLYSILDDLDFQVSLVRRTAFVHKEYGMFEINIDDIAVYFVPSYCIWCNLDCPNRRRHICIVLDESSQTWDNVGLRSQDLLFLSKAVALENDWIPDHVRNQIKNSLYCRQPGTSLGGVGSIRDQMLQELRRLRNIMTGGEDPPRGRNEHREIPPQEIRIGIHTALLRELRDRDQSAR